MLQTLKELEARSSEAKATAFHHLLLLVGINLFKVWWLGREGGAVSHMLCEALKAWSFLSDTRWG